MTEEQKPRRGRPPRLTEELQTAICLAIRTTKMSLADCAESSGVSIAAVYKWLEKGKKAKRGPYRDFFVEVRRARADGTKMLLARIAKAGQEPKHWQANVALLSMTEPQYAPRVRMAVEEQLVEAVERLKVEFSNEPQILERALAAIAGIDRAQRIPVDDGGAPGGGAGGDGEGGEAVHSPPSVGAPEPVPNA